MLPERWALVTSRTASPVPVRKSDQAFGKVRKRAKSPTIAPDRWGGNERRICTRVEFPGSDAMNRATALLVLLVACFAQPVRAAAPGQGEASHEAVITGEVVETGCFVIAARRGEAHRQCGIACARAGQPLGIFDEHAGTLYLAIFDRSEALPDPPLSDFVADRVEVHGSIVERGGVLAIVVKRVRSLSPPRDAG